MSRRARLRGYVVILAGSILLACGDEPPTGPPAQMVGPDGGVLSFADGSVSLAFPRGALSTEIAVTVQPFGEQTPNARLVAGTAYDIRPSTIEFAVPVYLRIRYDVDSIPEAVYEEHLRLYRQVGSDWTKIKGSEVDVEDSRVRAEVGSLGVMGVFGAGPYDALRGGIALVMSPPVHLFPGDSIAFDAFTENVSGERMQPQGIVWSVSDASVLVLSLEHPARCYAKGRSVGEAYLTALVEEEFVDSVLVSVADDREPTVVGAVERVEPQPDRRDFALSLLVRYLDPPQVVIRAHVLDYTSIYVRRPGDSLLPGHISDLSVGDTISAWSIGGVWTSEPAQFAATRIEIIHSE